MLLRLTFLSALSCLTRAIHPGDPSLLFLQQVSPGFQFGGFGSSQFPWQQQPAQRDSVRGFGTAQSPTAPFGGFTSFSNPPPPLGNDQMTPQQMCGVVSPFCTKSRYRSIDGSCNNLQNPSWGIPQTPYGRLTPYNYGNGINSWPRAISGRPLPNPRELSLRLFPDKQLIDPVWNLNAQQWGQIITHDMSLTAGINQIHNAPPSCCSDQGRIQPNAAANPQCAPIIVPPNDPIHAPQGTQCFNFMRTTTTRDRGCTSPHVAAEPITTVTGYMDLSIVYGSSAAQAAPIRAGVGGRMVSVLRKGREWPPQDPNVTATCESVQSPGEACYLAGDVRVNQNPELTLLQVILLREHNRIATELLKLNPHWDDETTFQEARRIHIAEIQHINYYEYLPIFLGLDNMVKNKLIYPGAVGYVNDYNPTIDPSVLDEHATAAFRTFHSLIRGYLQLMSENRELLGAVRLSDWFNRPMILEVDTAFEDLTRGMTAQSQHFSDQFWDSEVTQFLFRRNNTFGGDLRATDIQRGRDHGLGTYVAAREACGLRVPHTFKDMTDFISPENVNVLATLYESPLDVDLVVAGSLEQNVPGAQTGPTFLCIITEQFYRTRTADRFFYENGADPDIAFTPSQLQAIRNGASMARLLCDNADGVQLMQPKAFQLINPGNKLVPCEQLPAIDLTLWQDARSPL